MRSCEIRWPGVGILAGALCLTLAGLPGSALAQDDDESDGPQVEKEVRVYTIPGDDEDAGVGYLGVRVQDITRELQEAKDLNTDQGALVSRVDPDGPADEAGIRRGDVIVEVNKTSIGDAADLTRTIRAIEPGKKVPVVVVREGNRKTFSVTIAERPGTMVFIPRGRHGKGGAPMFEWQGGPGEGGTAFEWQRDFPGAEGMQRLRAQRVEIQRQLKEIQEQLEQLRETDFAKLEAELQAIRDELRQMMAKPKPTRKATP
jgi:membrane-associated protease RseP (regulator of RpoE activity)